ncbi:MAG: polysaccharide deacetylase family protein [Sporomusaceae bacterium]|nr:polysaccharide deacetylase family protein [Sporomusaceae bacterium]
MWKTKALLLLALLAALGIGGLQVKETGLKPQAGTQSSDAAGLAAEAEIARAMQLYRDNPAPVPVIAGESRGLRRIALTFDGIADHTTMLRLLELLQKNDAKATFFVDGLQAAENPETVAAISEAGQKLGNYALSGMAAAEGLPPEQLIGALCRSQAMIQASSGQSPVLLRVNAGRYTKELLQAARASGLSGAAEPGRHLTAAEISSLQAGGLQAAETLVRQLQPGGLLSVKLSAAVAPLPPVTAGKTEQRPAIDKQPGLKELALEPLPLTDKVVEAVEKLLLALAAAGYATVDAEAYAPEPPAVKPPGLAASLRSLNTSIAAELTALLGIRTGFAAPAVITAEPIKTIATTEQALAYSFSGLANTAAVDDVLVRLQRLDSKATFFVMETEMRRYPQTLRKIIAAGHEIGLAIPPQPNSSREDIQALIANGRALLQDQFGVATKLISQPWGIITAQTQEAVGLSDCLLISQAVNVVQSQHRDYTDANQVINEIFKSAMTSLSRGQIVHFRLDYYSHDRLAGELAEAIKQQKIDNIAYITSFDRPETNPANDSAYRLKPVGVLLENSQSRYQYPVAADRVLSQLRGDQPLAVKQQDFLREAAKRYIGHEFVNDENRMLGFSRRESRRLDKSGLIHTDDNVIFLTFDDWGTDASVNKLLYVLRKHRTPATFFILTNNVLHNPNLLRSIAADGHEIAGHTDKHKPMTVADPVTGRLLAPQTREEYREDLTLSYEKLRSVVGDMVVDGRPALTRFFRPPTLAVSKMGFETLFETGYEYIISGSYSTSDYQAGDIAQMVREIKTAVYTADGKVQKGAVPVMHMGESSVYTAMALDIVLTANAAKPDSDPSKFTVGRLSDYVKDGYAQVDWK